MEYDEVFTHNSRHRWSRLDMQLLNASIFQCTADTNNQTTCIEFDRHLFDLYVDHSERALLITNIRSGRDIYKQTKMVVIKPNILITGKILFEKKCTKEQKLSKLDQNR